MERFLDRFITCIAALIPAAILTCVASLPLVEIAGFVGSVAYAWADEYYMLQALSLTVPLFIGFFAVCCRWLAGRDSRAAGTALAALVPGAAVFGVVAVAFNLLTSPGVPADTPLWLIGTIFAAEFLFLWVVFLGLWRLAYKALARLV